MQLAQDVVRDVLRGARFAVQVDRDLGVAKPDLADELAVVACVESAGAATTTLTMPAAEATVTATYISLPPTQYALTVNGGFTNAGTVTTRVSVLSRFTTSVSATLFGV